MLLFLPLVARLLARQSSVSYCNYVRMRASRTTSRHLQYARGLQQMSATRARINVDKEVVHVTDNNAQEVKNRTRLAVHIVSLVH